MLVPRTRAWSRYGRTVATGDRRARALALTATGLATGGGFRLPADLELWRIAGGRPAAAAPIEADDPAGALVAALEAALTAGERKQGAHYTPAPLADDLVARAVARPTAPITVVDPACGGGAILLAAGRHLVARGLPVDVVARDLLWGADIDPLAAAVAEAAVALWSRGVAPAPGHVVAGDVLSRGRAAWLKPPAAGFDLVVGNPPFQGQLAADTVRGEADRDRLRERYGAAVTPYVDTAALFLLAAVDLARRGGRVSLLQPRSTAGARDAGPVRQALARRARLLDLWVPPGRPFRAAVHVCAPVLSVGRSDPAVDWAAHLAAADGVPPVELDGDRPLGDVATATAGFRQHFYGLAPHVREAGRSRVLAPLVTSGAIGVGTSSWGVEPIRYSGRLWDRPAVDRRSLARDDAEVSAWAERLSVPKVLVAAQTRVVEAVADRDGAWVPCTPVISLLPRRGTGVDLLAAAVCSPPAAAWFATRAAGTGLSPGAIRLTPPLLLALPVPQDRHRWRRASTALAEGDLAAFAEHGTAMHRLPDDVATAVTAWWRGLAPGG